MRIKTIATAVLAVLTFMACTEKPVKPETPAKPAKPHVPRTGDPYQMTVLWILLLSAAGMATAGFAWRRQ